MAQSLCRGQYYFFGSAKAALDGAVHIALPFPARLLAGKEHPLMWECQQRMGRRWKRRIEQSIPAARPRVIFPANAMASDQTRVTAAEKREPFRQAAGALGRE